jgi:hypothetical protein
LIRIGGSFTHVSLGRVHQALPCLLRGITPSRKARQVRLKLTAIVRASRLQRKLEVELPPSREVTGSELGKKACDPFAGWGLDRRVLSDRAFLPLLHHLIKLSLPVCFLRIQQYRVEERRQNSLEPRVGLARQPCDIERL